ncbi:YnfC family lipoprotein [Citrobacter amalonaticus]|uniref:YnfC family lipoprotein n=1 Tax=Citrobacter amalonaticus TaxID=35703 RepID=UPI000A3AC1C3
MHNAAKEADLEPPRRPAKDHSQTTQKEKPQGTKPSNGTSSEEGCNHKHQRQDHQNKTTAPQRHHPNQQREDQTPEKNRRRQRK